MSEKRFSVAAVVPDVNIRAETFYHHGLDQLDILVYIHLRFKPHGSEFTADSLTAELQALGWRGANHALIGKRAVTASLRRLAGALYIRKRQEHSEGGKFGGVSYEFFPIQQQTATTGSVKPQVAPFATDSEGTAEAGHVRLPAQSGSENTKPQVAPHVGDDRMRATPFTGENTKPQVAPHVGDDRMRASASDGDDRTQGVNPQVAPRAAVADMRSSTPAPLVVGTTTTTNHTTGPTSRAAQHAAEQPRAGGRFARKIDPQAVALAEAADFLQALPCGIGPRTAQRLAAHLLARATEQGWARGPELAHWLADDPKNEVRRWGNVLPTRIADLPRYRPGLVRLPGQVAPAAQVITCARCADAASEGLRPGQVWGERPGPTGEPVDVVLACDHKSAKV